MKQCKIWLRLRLSHVVNDRDSFAYPTALAQFEAELIRERTRAGLAAASARYVTEGASR